MIRLIRHGKDTPLARRVAAGLLSLVLVLGMLPAVAPQAQAASWAQPYIDRLVDYGVMRSDIPGSTDPDQPITRAEFFSIINRAFGYNKMGPTPFTDVPEEKWYADDIAIAYNSGYMTGTTPTTAGPEEPLYREQAVYLMGKNLMLEESVGEVLGFADSRTLSSWSRGMIATAVKVGIVSGDPNGNFNPFNDISRGEAACMLLNAVGTLINTPGERSLGTVTGNVTINTPGVTLRDTVIAGDLHLTGGIGLGDVMLNNVNVLGKIVVSGAGEGNQGDSSIILRNVSADEMLLDSLSNQFVTIRAEGDTTIGETNVRTPAYLEDTTAERYGLRLINLDGEAGTEMQLAGNIKEVVNYTSGSRIVMAQGTAEKITVDEDATAAQLQIDGNARVKELNLDVGTTVTGTGDVDHLNVYAPGSIVTMLPNTITIRPGITAAVGGEVMDSTAAAESSEDPRLLAGYPVAKNIAPNTADALFSTNKRGTVYWALTALTDGSVGEEDLITPPAYSTRILSSGTLPAASSKTELTAKLSSLISDGSYYVSALMVDNRGQRSPVKVTAFTTPDNTVPNFASGYPYMSKIDVDTQAGQNYISAQVAVMPTKSCILYYALLNKGAAAPTVENFRTGSISGALGYGSRAVTKNTIDLFYVNDRALMELTDYDLYLVLVDADGGMNSGVKKLSFNTPDRTPPVFVTLPNPTRIQATSVTLTASINENGNIFWVAVPEGTEYPKPLSGQTAKPALDSELAKVQVANGMNAFKSGSAAATANRDVALNINGLAGETAYDVYYVARDRAGNYSAQVQMITIHTLDETPPTVTQTFDRTNDSDGKQPMPDTNISLIFNEGVCTADESHLVFLELYNRTIDTGLSESERAAAVTAFANVMRQCFTLIDADSINDDSVPERVLKVDNTTSPPTRGYYVKTGVGSDIPMASYTGDWIDYSKVVVSMDEGKTIFTFKNINHPGVTEDEAAVRLSSGGKYYFELTNISDTSNNKNPMRPDPYKVEEFQIVFAEVQLRKDGVTDGPREEITTTTPSTWQDVRVDMAFQLHPRSTGSVSNSICYDVLLWMDNTVSAVEFDIYGRVVDENGQVITDTTKMSMLGSNSSKTPSPGETTGTGTAAVTKGKGWVKLGSDFINSSETGKVGKSLTMLLHDNSNRAPFAQLNTLTQGWTYEFAIQITKVNGIDEYDSWSQRVQLDVTVPAGTESELRNLAASVSEDNWAEAVKANVSNIGRPEDFYVHRQFTDNREPQFQTGYPSVDPADTSADLVVNLSRAGTVYWAVAPVTKNSLGNWSQYLITKIGDHYVMPDGTGNNPSNKDDLTENPDTGTGNTYDLHPPKEDVANWKKFVTQFGGSEANGVLTTPTELDIFQHNFGNPDIKSGVYTVTGPGRIEIPVVSAGDTNRLLPETDYLAYFVLRGTSQKLSQVYCFQFRTSAVKKPIINLQASNSLVTFGVDQPSNLDYAILSYGEMPDFLKEDFGDTTSGSTTTTGHAIASFASTGWASDTTACGKDGDPTNFSVLDALIAKTPSGASVFDEYAKPTSEDNIRLYVAQLTRGEGSYSGLLMGKNGLANMAADSTQTKDVSADCTKPLSVGQEYLCLAVARNVRGEVDSFAAINNVRKRNTNAPEFEIVLTNISTYYKRDDAGTETINGMKYTNLGSYHDQKDVILNPNDYLISGTVMVNFSELLYYMSNSTGVKLLMDGMSTANALPYTGGTADTGDTAYFERHIYSTIPLTSTATSVHNDSFVFSFTQIPIGGTIRFPYGGRICNESSERTLKTLTLTLEADPTWNKVDASQANNPMAAPLGYPGFTYTWN